MTRKLYLLLLFLPFFSLTSQAQSKQKLTDFKTVLEGSLNHEAAMMMHLEAQKGKISGEYYLQLKQEDILLEGTVDKKGNVYIEELNFKGKKLGVFQGKISPELVFTGKWYPMNSDDFLPVMLMPSEHKYDYLKIQAGLNRTHIWWDRHRGEVGKGKQAWNPGPDEVTSIEWISDSYNFGKVKQGEKVEFKYTFKNTGKKPLKVMKVKPSCGCTSPQWSKEPIPPGEEGFILLVFDSAGKGGIQKKVVTVVTNTQPTHKVLTFTGEVDNLSE